MDKQNLHIAHAVSELSAPPSPPLLLPTLTERKLSPASVATALQHKQERGMWEEGWGVRATGPHLVCVCASDPLQSKSTRAAVHSTFLLRALHGGRWGEPGDPHRRHMAVQLHASGCLGGAKRSFTQPALQLPDGSCWNASARSDTLY